MSSQRAALIGMIPTGNPLACASLKAASDADPALRGRVETEVLAFNRFGDLPAIAAATLARRPAVVGVSSYIWNAEASYALARELKRAAPEVFIVFGGPAVAWRTESHFARAPIDACAVGEGELTWRELLGARLRGEPLAGVDGMFWREGLEIRRSKPRAQIQDLESLPSPYLDGTVPVEEHASLWLETSRGCPFDCAFCDWQKNQRVRNFPLERILDEVRLIAARRPDATVSFTDADLFIHKERARHLLPALLEAAEGTALRFEFETNLGHWDDDLMRLADNARVSLSCGIQTLNPRALATAHRDAGVFRLDRLVTALVRRERLAPRASVSPEVIFGMPDDELAYYRKTLDWALSSRIENVTTPPFLVLPGSPFAEDPDRWGLEVDSRPPYRLLSSASFSESDMAAAAEASFAANLALLLGWHVTEALRYLGRAGRGETPMLAAFEGFVAALASDGRFPWIEPSRRLILRSLNFNFSDPISPAPEEVLSSLANTELLASRDLPEILSLLQERGTAALEAAGLAARIPPLVRFLRAARSRFERRRLSGLDSFRRLIAALAGMEGRWLVVAPDEDREFYAAWAGSGRRVALMDPGGDALRAAASGAPVLNLDAPQILPELLSSASAAGRFDGVILTGLYSYLPGATRDAALEALARVVRSGGRLIVIDDGLGFHPFHLGEEGLAANGGEPAADLFPGALARNPWRLLRSPTVVRSGSAGAWTVVAAERIS